VCNHPCLSYPPQYALDPALLVQRCGKFAVLDRMLVKLHATGHRVLLFSTMTKLLDLLEDYLRWRTLPVAARGAGPGGGNNGGEGSMGYLRIDGSTALEDRHAHSYCRPYFDIMIPI
jgi:SWI/SNF-related matrix-associated actin-dependent regulator of chromatin subfamily A protein 2/4